jgi:hypothetical protein
MDDKKKPENWEIDVSDEEINKYGQKLADWGTEEGLTPERLCVLLRVVSDAIAEDLGIQFLAVREIEEDLH